MKNTLNVAVLGSSGYVGMELVNYLSKHKNVNLNFLGTETNSGKYLTNINNTNTYNNLPILKYNNEFVPEQTDCVFLALPHEISNKYVKRLYNKIKIIDLSADFRLDDIKIYKENYGNNHLCEELLNKFTYGLAEINREKIVESNNIAVPGCYPTSILLPLIPLLKKNIISTNNIIIDSKSGYSGAGKKFDVKNIKLNNNLNFYNYNTNEHRHMSEIKQELQKNTSNEIINFSFNPHILPNFRGMISTIYCELNHNFNIDNVKDIFASFEKNNPFIKFIKNDERLDFFSVQFSNFCKIKILKHNSNDKLIIVSAIDNLIKGAAGQAVQCFNLMEGIDETSALI